MQVGQPSTFPKAKLRGSCVVCRYLPHIYTHSEYSSQLSIYWSNTEREQAHRSFRVRHSWILESVRYLATYPLNMSHENFSYRLLLSFGYQRTRGELTDCDISRLGFGIFLAKQPPKKKKRAKNRNTDLSKNSTTSIAGVVASNRPNGTNPFWRSKVT